MTGTRLVSAGLLATALLAGVLSSAARAPGGWAAVMEALSDRGGQRERIEGAIERFNKYYGLYFDTGGETMGLSEFPATNPVKRRIFQDIATWRKNGQAFMHDNFGVRLTRVEMLTAAEAVAETEEHWVNWVRDLETGDRMGKKKNDVKVRYFLSRRQGEWLIWDFRIFGVGEKLPPLERRQ